MKVEPPKSKRSEKMKVMLLEKKNLMQLQPFMKKLEDEKYRPLISDSVYLVASETRQALKAVFSEPDENSVVTEDFESYKVDDEDFKLF